MKKAGLFTVICYMLEKHKLDVVSAHVSSDQNRTMYMIQAHGKDSSRSAFRGISTGRNIQASSRRDNGVGLSSMIIIIIIIIIILEILQESRSIFVS
ncbi:unnamed protein product [Camellia sinensis]